MIGSALLIILIIIIIISIDLKLAETAVNYASEKTQFNTTFFEIYDKSVDEHTCDRLIVVNPMSWHIWAINGSVYLLNESNRGCPINYTPAMKVPKNKETDLSKQVFKDVCLNRVFNTIVTSYTDTIQPVIVDFKITDLQAQEGRFTILDALNFLFTKYITMEKPEISKLRQQLNLTTKIPDNFIHHTMLAADKIQMEKILKKNKLKNFK